MNKIDCDLLLKKYYRVISKKDNSVIASGQCLSIKRDWGFDTSFSLLPLISFDDKYFYIFNGNKNYTVEQMESVSFYQSIPLDYKIENWSDFGLNQNADIYREYGYDELDKEVEYLVHQLNKIPEFRTTASCCGHDENPLFVCIVVEGEQNLKIFQRILDKHFKDKFNFNIYRKCQDNDLYRLSTKSIGLSAYRLADDLGDTIEKYLSCF